MEIKDSTKTRVFIFLILVAICSLGFGHLFPEHFDAVSFHFRSSNHFPNGKQYTNSEEIKNPIERFIFSVPESSYESSIKEFVSRLKRIIKQGGEFAAD